MRKPRLVQLPKVEHQDGYGVYTKRRLRRRVAEGTLPFYKIGGLVFIDLNDLDDEIAASRRDPRPAA